VNKSKDLEIRCEEVILSRSPRRGFQPVVSLTASEERAWTSSTASFALDQQAVGSHSDG
jgi:hypothetical protein